MSRQRCVRALAALALALAVGALAAPAPALATPTCADPGSVSAAVPWPQTNLAFQRAWPVATGSGVLVAVLDSGVDAGHPQLTGKVATGADFLHGNGGPGGTTDCVGHGTAVSSVIVAQSRSDSGLLGVAPGARILPVTVSEKEAAGDNSTGDAATPAQFGAAVRWAVQHHARVLNLSVVYYTDHPEIRSAIEYALANDVVVVAAVGNLGADTDRNPTPYPAAYPGVIGVGAVDRTGAATRFSGHGGYVDLVAPGDEVVAATPNHGHAQYAGTSLATGFVSGTVALVRQYWPALTVQQVAQRLAATADPAAGGAAPDYYGRGLVDPYRAVTDRLDAGQQVDAPVAPVDRFDAAAQAAAAHARVVRRRALAVAALGGALAVVALVAAGARRRGRRTRWQAARAQEIPPAQDDTDPVPVGLFEQPPG